MKRHLLKATEVASYVCAVSLLGFFLVATVHGRLLAKTDVARFTSNVESRAQIKAVLSQVDTEAWSEGRLEAYNESLEKDLGLPEALLKIPAIDLEAPVWEGVDTVTLNRAVGRVPETSLVDEGGNTVLAAHRDGYFRKLGELETGDAITVQTAGGEEFVYRVESSQIVDPDAVEVMAPTDDSVLTLITCYPFYFVGSAPQRYVVRAVSYDNPKGN